MSSTRLGKKGRVTVPAEIRGYLKLKPGDRIEYFIRRDGRAILIPRKGQRSI